MVGGSNPLSGITFLWRDRLDLLRQIFRRGDGVAERARLEIACGSKAHRGFESPPLRFEKGMRTAVNGVRIFIFKYFVIIKLRMRCIQRKFAIRHS